MRELGSGALRAMGALLETTGVRPLAMLAAVPLGKRRLGAAGAARGPSPSHDARCVWPRDRTLLILNPSQPLRTQARPIPGKSAGMLFNTKSRDQFHLALRNRYRRHQRHHHRLPTSARSHCVSRAKDVLHSLGWCDVVQQLSLDYLLSSGSHQYY